MTAGVDYAFSPHPSPEALKAAGVRFVMRYISSYLPNDSNGKNLLGSELAGLLAAGLEVGVVAEEVAGLGGGWMLGGYGAGQASARHAEAVVATLRMPGIPVYFAADFDASPAQQAAIGSCLDGAASVIGRERTGIYGSYYVVQRSLDAGKARYAWQTAAWSGGQWDSRANLRQGLARDFGGVQCDADTAMTADFGQWPRPAVAPSPVQEDDMPSGSFANVTTQQTASWPDGTAKGITIFAPASVFSLEVHHSADGGSWYEVPTPFSVADAAASASYTIGSPEDVNGVRVTFRSGAAGATWHTF